MQAKGAIGERNPSSNFLLKGGEAFVGLPVRGPVLTGNVLGEEVGLWFFSGKYYG